MFNVKLTGKQYLTVKAILENALMDNHYELSKISPDDTTLNGFIRETHLNIAELNSLLEVFANTPHEKS